MTFRKVQRQQHAMQKAASVLAITVTLIVAVHVAGAFVWTGLYPHTWYVGLDGLYLLLTVQIALIAFFLVRTEQTALRIALSNSAIVVASLCCLLTVSDLYFMAFRYDTSGLGGIEVFTHKNWHKRYARSNQLGYWERDLGPYLEPPKPGREVVITAVGDSWTWGQGIRGRDLRFTNLLEFELRSDPGLPVTVLNFGRAGADTAEEMLLLQDAAKVHPDIVLIGYLANDIDRSASIKPFTVGESPFFHRSSLLSPTLNFFYWRTLGPRSYGDFGKEYVQAVRNAYGNPAIMAKHLSDIETLIAKVRAIDAMPVFAVLPFPAMWQANAASENDPPSNIRQLRNDVYGKIAARVRSLGVPVIEAQTIEDEMSASEFALTLMDNHPSERAHRRIALVLATEFRKQNLLQPTRNVPAFIVH